jgi:hypothetical protein
VRAVPAFSALLLALCVGVSGAFFFSFWGCNAEGLGRRDVGMALALSFLVPLTVYASLVLALVAAVAVIAARRRRRALYLRLAALVIALLPSAFLLLVDSL